MMKRPIFLVMLLLTVVFAYSQNSEAVIKEMTGTVELKTAGSTRWIAARTGDRIEKSTTISTGFKSIAIIALGNSTLTVRPLTNLSLNELLTRNSVEEINIGLKTGRVRVDVKPPAGSKSNVTVQTPTATASVRGTTFDISPVILRVDNGQVQFTSAAEPSRPVLVGAGQSSQIDPKTGKALTPLELADAERNLPLLPGMMPGLEKGRLEKGSGEVIIIFEE